MRHALTQRVPRRGGFPAHRAAPCARRSLAGGAGGGAFAAQGCALCLTQPGPPFCLPARRLPPLPARRPVHAAARRSAVVVVFALCRKEGGGDQQRQRLGRHNGKPDAVQPDKGGQRQHHGHLKYERAQK